MVNSSLEEHNKSILIIAIKFNYKLEIMYSLVSTNQSIKKIVVNLLDILFIVRTFYILLNSKKFQVCGDCE